MVALSWAASLVGVVSFILFTYWLFKADQLKTRFLRNAFITGFVVFSVFFIVFTAHTLSVIPGRTHSSSATPSVDRGKRAWHKYVCIDCHTLLGNGAYYAPDLTKAWDRFVERTGDEKTAETAMIAFLKNPPQATSERRGMPDFGMSDEEAVGLTHFLRWISRIDTNDWPPKPSRPLAASQGVSPSTSTVRPVDAAAPAVDGKTAPSDETASVSGETSTGSGAATSGHELAEKGRALFVSKGCKACHSIGKGRIVGPDLANIPPGHDVEFLTRWIQDPNSVYRQIGTKPLNKGYPPMPKPRVTADEARALAEFLKT